MDYIILFVMLLPFAFLLYFVIKIAIKHALKELKNEGVL